MNHCSASILDVSYHEVLETDLGDRWVITNHSARNSGSQLGYEAPLVSFIVLSYNNAEYLPATLRSVAEQTFKQLEVVIADDGSTDTSAAIIREFVRTTHLMATAVLWKQNGGIARNYNACLSLIQGKYVAHIGSDDINERHRVQSQLLFLSQSTASMCISGMQIIDSKSRYLRQASPRREIQNLAHVLEAGAVTVTSPTMFYRRELIDRFNLLPPELANEDEALAFRALCSGGILVMDESLVKYRVHAKSVTSSNRVMRLKPYIDWLRSNLPYQVANKRHWIQVLKAVQADEASTTRAEELTSQLRSRRAFLDSLQGRGSLSLLGRLLLLPAGRKILRQYFAQLARSARIRALIMRAAVRQ